MAEQKKERDYTRPVYQNLMTVVDLLGEQSPLPMTQKQIQKASGLTKNVVFDICWNLINKGWAENSGDGAIRLIKSRDEKESWIGRMVTRLVRDAYGTEIGD